MRNGQATFTAVVFLMVIGLALVLGFSSLALRESKISRIQFDAKRSYFLSEAGQEDAVYRLRTSRKISTQELIALDGYSASTTVTQNGSDREIVSTGDVISSIRKTKTVVREEVAGTSFVYGAQVGEGGLEMDNNSRIEGSVYSNGSIIGAPGATITGDAFVAGGTSTALNQSWEIQNTGVAVGALTGSVVTVVDSAGAVGSYTSLLLGNDGLARVSYIDETNFNLKLARCLDQNCTSRNLTTVDAPGDIDEVTSIALGQDGFPRISYYHDGNDNLKFARCTNEDCNTPVLTAVDTPNNVGDFSSLKMGSDGFTRIAYWYDTAKDVRFARCLNDDCTLRNISNVDTTGDVGEYISLALGADGFGRMSYYDDTSDDLRFTRCTDVDCSSSVRTVVDSAGNTGKFTSIVLGSDGLARISYFDDTNDDLKFARCTNEDCTTRNIATVDSAGTVGHYTSIAMGPDGFPRISYYDPSNGDLKFARCTNADCASAQTTTVDNASSVGLHDSLAIGSDGFGRISYWAQSDRDLRYVRCNDDKCSPPLSQADVAQSFRPTVTDRIVRVDLFLRKVGNPASTTLRIITDSGGRPSSSASNVLAVGTINSGLVGSSYSWISIWLTTTPTISAETPYWIVFDSVEDNSNYYVWGADLNAGYTRGNALASADWQSAVWTAISEDLDFRVFMGGMDTSMDSVSVNANAKAHIVNNATVGGNVDGFNVANTTIGGGVNANSLTNCTVGGNAAYNGIANCTVGGTKTTPTVPPADPVQIPLPIPASVIQQWKDDAAAGGTCVPPQCQANGDFDPSACEVSLGPKKITGSLILNASCAGGQLLNVTGTIWVVGNIDISNNARVRLVAGYEESSGVIIADGWIHNSNNGLLQGSGVSGSYLMLISTAAGGGHHGSAIDLHNNATGAIFYAGGGLVWLHNNVTVTELVGWKVHLDQNAVLTYEIGLQNVRFSSGPGGGFNISSWQEIP